jgi:hypothetical protein
MRRLCFESRGVPAFSCNDLQKETSVLSVELRGRLIMNDL